METCDCHLEEGSVACLAYASSDCLANSRSGKMRTSHVARFVVDHNALPEAMATIAKWCGPVECVVVEDNNDQAGGNPKLAWYTNWPSDDMNTGDIGLRMFLRELLTGDTLGHGIYEDSELFEITEAG